MLGLITFIQARLVHPAIERLQREEGQTMAEYAVLLTVIAIVVLTAATIMGKSISSIFSSIAAKV
jgi:Flp pilus assembly pilin Flp